MDFLLFMSTWNNKISPFHWYGKNERKNRTDPDTAPLRNDTPVVRQHTD